MMGIVSVSIVAWFPNAGFAKENVLSVCFVVFAGGLFFSFQN